MSVAKLQASSQPCDQRRQSKLGDPSQEAFHQPFHPAAHQRAYEMLPCSLKLIQCELLPLLALALVHFRIKYSRHECYVPILSRLQ